MSKRSVRLSWDGFDAAVDYIACQVRCVASPPVGVYGVPRGGLPLAVALSHRLGLPMVGREALADRRCLWVDDIVDSGRTLARDRAAFP